MTESDNVWLYAVVADRPLLTGMSGVAGEAPRVIAGPGVAAVAGSVPHADFDEQPLHARLEDAVWLERTVRAHHRVVDALAGSGPCLPMRFATVYRDDQRVVAMLQSRCGELLAALKRITDCSEWGVKVYLGRAPATASDGERTADDKHPGTAYLLRRKTQHEDRRQALQQAMDEAQQIHTSLGTVATAATQHDPQSAEASGRAEPMILNGAYLVDDRRKTAFYAAVGSLADRHPELRVEVTGPWPPYSFSGVGAGPDEE